jgi:hypothetical protein
MPEQYHEHCTEQDAMIRDLAHERAVPYPIFPDTAREGGPIPVGHEEINRQALEWRRKLIAEIERRPDWVAEWRAEQALNARIEELCEERGLRFMPHEWPRPWDTLGEPSPDDDEYTRKARALRKRLIAELEGRVGG